MNRSCGGYGRAAMARRNSAPAHHNARNAIAQKSIAFAVSSSINTRTGSISALAPRKDSLSSVNCGRVSKAGGRRESQRFTGGRGMAGDATRAVGETAAFLVNDLVDPSLQASGRRVKSRTNRLLPCHCPRSPAGAQQGRSLSQLLAEGPVSDQSSLAELLMDSDDKQFSASYIQFEELDETRQIRRTSPYIIQD